MLVLIRSLRLAFSTPAGILMGAFASTLILWTRLILFYHFSLNGCFVEVRCLDAQSRLALSNVAPEISDFLLPDVVSLLWKVSLKKDLRFL